MERCSVGFCTEPLAQTCCKLFFCKSHYKQHSIEAHRSSAVYRASSAEELDALQAGLEALSQSRVFSIRALFDQGRSVSERAIQAQRIVCDLEQDIQSLLELKTQGIPVTTTSHVAACFLKARVSKSASLADQFLFELAKLGYMSPRIAAALYRRSQVAIEANQTSPDTIADLKRCIEIRSSFCQDQTGIAPAQALLSKALFNLRNWQEAGFHATKAISIAGDDEAPKVEAYLVLGKIQHGLRNMFEAGKYFAHAAHSQKHSSTSPETRRLALINKGFAYELQGKYDRALRRYEKAKQRTTDLYGTEDVRTAVVSSHVARVLLRQDKKKSAETTYLQILPVLETAEERSCLKDVYHGLRSIYSQTKHKEHLLLYTEKHFHSLEPYEHQEQASLLQVLAQLCTNMKLHDKARQYQAMLPQNINIAVPDPLVTPRHWEHIF